MSTNMDTKTDMDPLETENETCNLAACRKIKQEHSELFSQTPDNGEIVIKTEDVVKMEDATDNVNEYNANKSIDEIIIPDILSPTTSEDIKQESEDINKIVELLS